MGIQYPLNSNALTSRIREMFELSTKKKKLKNNWRPVKQSHLADGSSERIKEFNYTGSK